MHSSLWLHKVKMDAQTGAAFPLAYHLMCFTQASDLRSNTPMGLRRGVKIIPLFIPYAQ